MKQHARIVHSLSQRTPIRELAPTPRNQKINIAVGSQALECLDGCIESGCCTYVPCIDHEECILGDIMATPYVIGARVDFDLGLINPIRDHVDLLRRDAPILYIDLP